MNSPTKVLRLNPRSSIVAEEYPAEWPFVRLGGSESGEFSNGINKGKGSYGSGCRFVNIVDVFRGFEISPDTLERVEVSAAEIERYRFD